MKSIKVAVIHPEIEHSAFKENSDILLGLNRRACSAGAKIIVNTEMSLSGYSFQSAKELENLTLNKESEIYKKFSELSAEFGNYICLGVAYREKGSNIIYNSAIVFGPDGENLLNYNKINGEYRWACCGDASQNNTFDTPWGKVGVLICSDSYFSLLTRATVLRGARMILIPANWPNMGMDPVEIWRARAVENGIPILGANRSGVDKTMDFENSYSAIIDYRGNYLVNTRSTESDIHFSEIELKDGLIDNDQHMMQNRSPEKYSNIYLNLKSLSSVQEHFKLPESEDVTIYSCSFIPSDQDFEELKYSVGKPEDKRIILFPEAEYNFESIKKFSEDVSCAVIFRNISEDSVKWHILDSGISLDVNEDEPELICSSAKIALLRSDELYHPERFYHFAKSGCDLCIVSGGNNFDNLDILSGIRAIENNAVAVAFKDYASVSIPPVGHSKWSQSDSTGRGYAVDQINTGNLRKKRLYHDYDYKILLDSRSV